MSNLAIGMTIATLGWEFLSLIFGGNMKKAIGLMFVIASASIFAMASVAPAAPEFGAPTVLGVLTMIGGGILVLRARLKK